MGVSLGELVNPVEIGLDILARKKIAVDALNVIYQFLGSIRQYNGTPLMDSQGRITSHLSGLFYRTFKLMNKDIKPCFVFDGKPPSFKSKTIQSRIESRKKARKEYKRALRNGNIKKARMKAGQSSKLTDEMIKESKELLEYMGVPVVQAPSEGEAQAVRMVKNKDVYACATQDYDSLLFGCPVLIRNLNITGKRKVPGKDEYIDIGPEKLVLKDVLNELGLYHDQLIMMGILIGTDFNPGGVYGIGPKRAYDLVKESGGNFDLVFKNVEWDFNINPKKIFDFFKNPKITNNYNLKWKHFDEEKIRELLCEKHGFSAKRVNNALERGRQALKKRSQTGLDKFL